MCCLIDGTLLAASSWKLGIYDHIQPLIKITGFTRIFSEQQFQTSVSAAPLSLLHVLQLYT